MKITATSDEIPGAIELANQFVPTMDFQPLITMVKGVQFDIHGTVSKKVQVEGITQTVTLGLDITPAPATTAASK